MKVLKEINRVVETEEEAIELFVDAALSEAYRLSKEITPEEKEKLVKLRNNIDPSSISGCVYGILTGCCENERSQELFSRCASTGFGDLFSGDNSLVDYINKKDIKEATDFYTPIESIIYLGIHEKTIIADFILGDITILKAKESLIVSVRESVKRILKSKES